MKGKNGFGPEGVLFKSSQQEEEMVNTATNSFYPDGFIAPFSLSSEQAPLAPLLAQAKASSSPQSLTQDQMAEACQLIRTNVKFGRAKNVEVQLNKGRQMFERQELPLGNTAIKLLSMDDDEPKYFFIKAGDTLDASVFLGGDNSVGIMVMRDENGDDLFLSLAEFHMLSLRENPDPRKEVGLMTSYLWPTAEVYSSVICAFSLNPIKNLLLSDWLQAEWQRAKDAAPQDDTKSAGGAAHE